MCNTYNFVLVKRNNMTTLNDLIKERERWYLIYNTHKTANNNKRAKQTLKRINEITKLIKKTTNI